MEGARRTLFPRLFSDSAKGCVLSEEERAAENVYIKKMERERMERKKLRDERDKANKDKGTADMKQEGSKA